MNSSKFREDINGLRAIAVLSVVIFHFSKDALPGGFAGVDIFFVISGFLMTSIIFRGIENKSFNIITFIKARAVRIVPALVLVIAIILILGYLFFGPVIYQAIGKHSLSSLFFVSNFIYMNESGYFDVESKGKFLLHTWSLSVEWQFYIIYPIILFLLSKYLTLESIKKLIIVATGVSFLLGIYVTIHDQSSAYFMIYSRAWEMMIGGIAFIYPLSTTDKKRKILEFFGILLIVFSLFYFNGNMAWPGYYAAVPVIGTYICILANNKRTLLSGIILRKLGLWSYSIYLVHWPILVFIQKAQLDLNFAWYFIIVMLFSITSYQIIEKKRDYKYGLVFSFILVAAVSYFVSIDGVSGRGSNTDYKLTLEEFREKYEGNSGLPATEDVMFINGSKNDFDYILVGDSHARHIFAYIINRNIKVASFATDSCKSTKHFFSKISYSFKLEQRCKNRYGKVVDFINENPGKKVIWMSAWRDGSIGKQRDQGNYKNNIVDEITYFIEDIKNSNSDIYIIGDTQGSDNVMYECLANGTALLGSRFSGCSTTQIFKESETENKLKSLAENTKRYTYIPASDALCINGACEIIKNGNPVYTDTQHLTKQSAQIVGSYIFSKIQ